MTRYHPFSSSSRRTVIDTRTNLKIMETREEALVDPLTEQGSSNSSVAISPEIERKRNVN